MIAGDSGGRAETLVGDIGPIIGDTEKDMDDRGGDEGGKGE